MDMKLVFTEVLVFVGQYFDLQLQYACLNNTFLNFCLIEEKGNEELCLFCVYSQWHAIINCHILMLLVSLFFGGEWKGVITVDELTWE